MNRWLFPFSIIYGSLVALRNRLFDAGVLKSTRFGVPVIVIGNLSVGGTGKTPMAQYILKAFSEDHRPAFLSRGYGRKTKGFFWVETDGRSSAFGDEALLVKSRFPEVPVAVCERRVEGIGRICADQPEVDLVVLDDAYQHRYVQPTLSVLLTTFQRPYYADAVLPAGRLRERRSGAKRADVIVVTKCPVGLSREDQAAILKAMNPKPWQVVFFAHESYGDLYHWKDRQETREWSSIRNVVLLTGLANAETLVEYVLGRASISAHYDHRDHHPFTASELRDVKEAVQIGPPETVVVTTEKDAQRLKDFSADPDFNSLPIFVLPLQTKLIGQDDQRFIQLIHDALSAHSGSR